MSETAHPSIDLVAGNFKSFVWDNALELGLTALFSEAPYLNIWLVRDIIRGVARMASDGLFNGLKLFADVTAIPIINADLKNKFDNTSAELKILAIKHGIDSPEFQSKREEASNAFADFIRNSATLPRS